MPPGSPHRGGIGPSESGPRSRTRPPATARAVLSTTAAGSSGLHVFLAGHPPANELAGERFLVCRRPCPRPAEPVIYGAIILAVITRCIPFIENGAVGSGRPGCPVWPVS